MPQEDFERSRKANSVLVPCFFEGGDEVGGAGAVVALFAVENLAVSVQQEHGRKAFDLEFLLERFVGFFQILRLGLATGKINLHQDEVGVGVGLESGGGKNPVVKLAAGWAPIGTGEIDEDGLVFGPGLGERGGKVGLPVKIGRRFRLHLATGEDKTCQQSGAEDQPAPGRKI